MNSKPEKKRGNSDVNKIGENIGVCVCIYGINKGNNDAGSYGSD